MQVSGAGKLELPDSGLAEEILASFLARAQGEADRNADTAREGEPGESHHLVSFRLAAEWYGVPIASVLEIVRAAGITRVPGAAAHLKGVVNLRGRLIPVVDLRRRFGLDGLEPSEQSRIIVVEFGEKTVGLLVDAVFQVLRVPALLVQELPEEACIGRQYIQGVGKLEDRLIFILDLARTLLLSR